MKFATYDEYNVPPSVLPIVIVLTVLLIALYDYRTKIVLT
jgi:hypothetical protein